MTVERLKQLEREARTHKQAEQLINFFLANQSPEKFWDLVAAILKFLKTHPVFKYNVLEAERQASLVRKTAWDDYASLNSGEGVNKSMRIRGYIPSKLTSILKSFASSGFKMPYFSDVHPDEGYARFCNDFLEKHPIYKTAKRV